MDVAASLRSYWPSDCQLLMPVSEEGDVAWSSSEGLGHVLRELLILAAFSQFLLNKARCESRTFENS